jgi:putative restriction endonuclease
MNFKESFTSAGGDRGVPPIRMSNGSFELSKPSQGLAVSLNDRVGAYHELLQPRGSALSDILEAAAVELEDDAGAAGPPASDYDARLRVVRQIVARRGQSGFRDMVMRAYGGRCAITSCDAAFALEAAHLRPYRGPGSNTVTNGLLLRADIHTLFDLGLLAIEPATRQIAVSKLIAATQYGSLTARALAEPAERGQRPNQEVLDELWEHFTTAEDGL